MKKKALLYLFLFTYLAVYAADSTLENSLFQQGMALFYKKNYTAAADYLGQVSDLNPNNVWARYYYVYSIASLGRKSEAAKWLPKLSSISNTSNYQYLVYFIYGNNSTSQIENKYNAKNKPQNSYSTNKKASKKSKSRNKSKKPDLLDEAESLIDAGENIKALNIIESYKQNNPNNGKVHKLLAMIDFQQKDYLSAVKNFEIAFKNGIKDFDSYFMAAQSCLDIQNYDTALDYYEKANKINNKDLFCKISLAELYCDRSNYANATILFNDILKNDPKYLDAKIGLIKIEFNKGYIKKALDLINNVITENADNAKAHYLKAQILLENKDYDNALKEANKASSLNQGNVEYLVFDSIVKIRNFKTQEAVKDLQKILKTYPNNTYALTALGEALLTEGKTEEGKAMLEKSQSIKRMPQTALLLALTECNNKNLDKAEMLYKEYCSLAGNSPAALLEYAHFTELKDNKDECLQAYHVIVERFPNTPFSDKAEQRSNDIKQALSKQSKEKYGILY